MQGERGIEGAGEAGVQRDFIRLLPHQYEAIAQEFVEVVVVVNADLQDVFELRPHQRLDLVDVHSLAPIREAAQIAEQGHHIDAPTGGGAVPFGECELDVLDVH